VGCTTASRGGVPGERKPMIAAAADDNYDCDDDDDDDDSLFKTVSVTKIYFWLLVQFKLVEQI
jgi:hypothetical protein